MQAPRKSPWHHLNDYFLPHPRNTHSAHLFSVKSIAVLVFAIIALEGAYLLQTKFVFLKTDFLASVLPGALMALTNQDRAAYGLSGLIEDPLLNKAAQAAADDMAKKGYFAHTSPDGKDPWFWLRQVGYRYSYAGENLAVNFTDSRTVQSAWMKSSTHRANIINKNYTHVGFGTANGVYEGRETTFLVEFFAAPAAAASPRTAAGATSAAQTSPASSGVPQVLGSQTAEPGSADSGIAAPTLLERLLASPRTTLTAILTVLLVIVSIVLIIAAFMRGRDQHPRVLIGGTLLLALIGTSLLASFVVAGPLKLVSGTQVAAPAAAIE